MSDLVSFSGFQEANLRAVYFLNPRSLFDLGRPGYFLPEQIRELNSFYALWEAVWAQTLRSLNSESTDLADHFFRFDFACALFDEQNNIAAFLCSSTFDIRFQAHREHSYLKKLPDPFFASQLKTSETKIGSLEYAYVNPLWRKDRIGISLVDVLVCLNAKELFSRGVQLLMAFTRNDRSVNKIIYGRGGVAISQNEIMHNVAIDSISIRHDDFKFDIQNTVDARIECLWRDRRYLGAHHDDMTIEKGVSYGQNADHQARA